MCELISTDTKEWAYSVFSRMSDEEFSKELMIIVLVRKLYLDNAFVDSFVFTYIDDIYEIMRDCKWRIPSVCFAEQNGRDA